MVKDLIKYYFLVVISLVLFSGCITDNNTESNRSNIQILSFISSSSPVNIPTTTPAPQTEKVIPELDENVMAVSYENVAVEVNYSNYIDWFKKNNLFIKPYILGEYVCGQYTVDMINDSERAGYKAYFAAITFSDSTGHALVSFKSKISDQTSWYFFEPQTNQLMSPESLAQTLKEYTGKTVTEVNIYGYFDDAGDRDPTTWRFDKLLYNKKY